MAFSLACEYVDDEGYYAYAYIHKAYGMNGPKWSNNQNYAMLFSTESAARRFSEKYGIPKDYEPKFIAMVGPKKQVRDSSKLTSKRLTRIESIREMEMSMPNLMD